jgi:hypothetical protein
MERVHGLWKLQNDIRNFVLEMMEGKIQCVSQNLLCQCELCVSIDGCQF